MEIQGKIIKILPLVTGESKNGQWKKQEFILETDTAYPKKICFSLWGEKVSLLENIEGQSVVVSFDLESREYNGRWFTEAKAWKIEVRNTVSTQEQHEDELNWLDDQRGEAEKEEDLPF